MRERERERHSRKKMKEKSFSCDRVTQSQLIIFNCANFSNEFSYMRKMHFSNETERMKNTFLFQKFTLEFLLEVVDGSMFHLVIYFSIS